ncbi:MAG: hypothetical protein EAX95_04275 [Candidatus Thorarchaeota archaeon]|nr:hypothetical protein [Candidatus Thorarchaeota archaeon]
MLQLGILDLSMEEIMLFFQDPVVVAWVLIGTGILAAVWLLENITDPIPLLGTIFDGIMAIGTYVGFFVGILDIVVGYVVWSTNPTATIVAGMLVLAGFSLSMRLLSKFPIALVLALGLAAFGTFTIYGLLTPYTTMIGIGDIIAQIVSLKGLIVIFIIIFAVVYLIAGLLIKLIQLIGKVFASTPVSVLIGLGAIAVGIIIFVNPAIVGLVVPWP